MDSKMMELAASLGLTISKTGRWGERQIMRCDGEVVVASIGVDVVPAWLAGYAAAAAGLSMRSTEN